MSVKITPEEIADLPSELVKQLSNRGPRHGNATKKLVALVKAADEPLSINQLLIGMYLAHGTILKRRNVQSLMHYAVRCGYVTRLDSGLYGPSGNPT